MLTVSLWDSCLSIENSDNEAINILSVSLWVSLWDPSFGPDENVDGLIVGPRIAFQSCMCKGTCP